MAAIPQFLINPKTVVIDPGHGGAGHMGGSDGNHAVSPSSVLEKDMTLDLAQLVEAQLNNFGGNRLNVILTRDNDVNLSLAARANVARDNQADIFVSIHFNGFNGVTRGVEAFVNPPPGMLIWRTIPLWRSESWRRRFVPFTRGTQPPIIVGSSG